MSEDVIVHYGMPRRSGRYPWGSTNNEPQRSKDFLAYVSEMRNKGLSQTEIAKGMGITTTQLRAQTTLARATAKQSDINQAQRLKDRGWSNVAIGQRMGIGESQVRALLAPGAKARIEVLTATSNMLKEQVDSRGYIDIGSGVENHIGVSNTRLAAAVAVLKEQGYEVHTVQVDQLGTGSDQKTLVKVLAPPGTTYRDIASNTDKIQSITKFSEDHGRSYLGLEPVKSIDSKRVAVVYAEDGGAEADGVICVRPGVDDVSLGGSRYAQVRIAVDDTHYLKGMAVYKSDMPPGVDLMFNTNKSNTGNKYDAMKELKKDPSTGEIDQDNPFGSTISRQSGVMNVLDEEGSWDTWSRTLSSQMLSKQSPALVETQLNVTYERRKDELDEILSLTNPAVKKMLLESYADGADAAAVHLKAAPIRGTASHVILPVNSLKPTEVYAPNYENGTRVALIRHPHGGTFEIPELIVNNNHRDSKKLLGQARDAIGINSQVAQRLSGADFDGDTVLVIPNNDRKVKSTPALEGLKNFDPQRDYPPVEGMSVLSDARKQMLMGEVSNLITDMTIKGANTSEIARAVRHSMVVIDAEKHKLNYKQSAIDNGINQLKEKYQGRGETGRLKGASTIVSRAKSTVYVPHRRPRPASKGGPVDPDTGRLVWEETGQPKRTKTVRLAETSDAHTLSSGTPVEKLYADHSNRLKALANQARKEAVHTPNVKYSSSAAKTYAKEVASLNAKLNVALKNRPLERQAQIVANSVVSAKRKANPGMTKEEDKRMRNQALEAARRRTGAKRQQIEINWDEWNAIQAGAVSNSKLNTILKNSDIDKVRTLAMPRENPVMTTAKQKRAASMISSGYTQAEVAKALGVSLSTLKSDIYKES